MQSAKYVPELQCIVFVYKDKVETVHTEPLGDWTHIQSREACIPYAKFLDTMVARTPDTVRRLTEVTLETLLDTIPEDWMYARIILGLHFITGEYHLNVLEEERENTSWYMVEHARKVIGSDDLKTHCRTMVLPTEVHERDAFLCLLQKSLLECPRD